MLEKIKKILRWSVFYKLYKKTLSSLANLINGNPSQNLIVIWVTWTDWKSSTSEIIHKILNDNLWKTALFTTVNQKFWKETQANNYKMTNVSAWKTQKFLKKAVMEQCKYCVLEVSSHGLDQKRITNIQFDAWVLTNITPEHLDYHKTFLNYANTKKKLFQMIINNKKGKWIAILNKDDKTWKQREEELVFNKTITYSKSEKWEIIAENIQEKIDWTEFTLKYLSKRLNLKTKLLWEFNINNILAWAATAHAFKIPLEDIKKSIEEFDRVKWRLNPYSDEKWAYYFIDYAHTPAWLEAVLTFLNNIKWDNKIITVFWAPWMRDKDKRPKMWSIVDSNSNIVILTDDDPDKEDRFEILKQVQKWVKREVWNDFWVMPDRELAVELAHNIAKKWDIVLIAWKWHETVQLTDTWKRHYSDYETLKLATKNTLFDLN